MDETGAGPGRLARSEAPPDSPPPGLWTRLPPPVRDLVTFLALAFFPIVPFRLVSGGATWMAALLIVQAAAVVLLGRRWPLIGLGVAVAFFVLAVALGVVNPVPSLPVAVAAFTVASVHGRRVSVIAVAVAGGLMALSSLLLVPKVLLDLRVLSVIAVVAAAAALGDAARSRRDYILAITERAVRAEETRETEAQRRVAEDRLQIARDLHDLVAHQIAVINLQAGVASAALRTQPADAEASLKAIRGASRAVLTEIADLLAVLRTTTSPDAVTIPPAGTTELAPVAGLEGLSRLVAKFADVGLTTAVEVEGSLADLTPAVDVVAYRVVQEGLTNAHKHGSGSVALAICRTDESLSIRLSNSRSSVRPGTPTPSGYGLQGVRERVESVRGTMQVESSAPDRFALDVVLPLQAQPSLAGPG